ncbi:hypothetical protein JCM3766R1_005594 [Sporobolomyces carnicolor]
MRALSRLVTLVALCLGSNSLLARATSTTTFTGRIVLPTTNNSTSTTVPLDLSARITLGGQRGFEKRGVIYGSDDSDSEYRFKFRLDHEQLSGGGGDYVLRIESTTYEFQSYLVRLSHDSTVEGVALFDEQRLTLVPGTWLPLPLVIHPSRTFPLVDDPGPASSSLVSIVTRNPVVWLLGGALALMLAVPKLIENLDPETLKEVRQSQQEMHHNMASLQSFDSSKLSKFLAGGGSHDREGEGEEEPGPRRRRQDEIPDLSTVVVEPKKQKARKRK